MLHPECSCFRGVLTKESWCMRADSTNTPRPPTHHLSQGNESASVDSFNMAITLYACSSYHVRTELANLSNTLPISLHYSRWGWGLLRFLFLLCPWISGRPILCPCIHESCMVLLILLQMRKEWAASCLNTDDTDYTTMGRLTDGLVNY